ncbi:pyruvate dehydrogenase (acetyl-transferring) E1 component subunit alpha [Streptomyces sp. LHD-70]|uniref:pyruvate dehydrogenase (acetyl-transferring) E1 component subunit alpha n=1 Tax=Streptomyces sp. LHD-70 TaxID=3072140 RepID=UPI00280F1B17|nr:pyruvate dehydrogenase (acetyl-transferring) E1 component subunit alpha [Streptomyces sp. LHD-70]MDQ8708125.1 pyruvate dehydrogenase (acetyl-transferring) E1 component subunit alpha [Streptomyces sp. LHD-70]
MTVLYPPSAGEDSGTVLLPSSEPLSLIDAASGTESLDASVLLELYRHLVRGRRFNQQATALTKQGRLAVYPSTTGQEASEVGAVLALDPQDWLIPTYRDTLALLVRGVDPVDALTLLRGDWHSGYDPLTHRTAPLSTPLATQTPHAVGLAHAAALRGDKLVVLAMIGDGGTSEGDFHEAMNFAAVYRSPVVFLVQNNGYAISVPISKQSAAPSLAHKAIGYGMPGVLVDGNDAAAVYHEVRQAVERAREGGGPTLIEALTYRIDAHTNADDATRYRDTAEVEFWLQRDPVTRMERHLRGRGLLDDAEVARIRQEAEDMAQDLRSRLATDPSPVALDLFDHVYAHRTPQLEEQRSLLAEELAAAQSVHADGAEEVRR